MHIAVLRDAFIRALQRVLVATNNRSVSDYGKSVLIEAPEGGDVGQARFFVNSSFLSIDTREVARVKRPGSLVVDCADLLGIVDRMPAGPVELEIDPNGSGVRVTSDVLPRRYRLGILEPQHYPPGFPPHETALTVELDKAELLRCLDQVTFPLRLTGETSSIDALPQRRGVLVVADAGALSFVCVAPNTGKATALVKGTNSTPISGTVFFPFGALDPLHRLLKDRNESAETLTVTQDDRAIYLRGACTQISAALPNILMDPQTYLSALSNVDRSNACEIEAEPLLAAMEAMEPSFSKNPLSAVEIRLNSGVLSLKTINSSVDAEDSVTATGTGSFFVTIDPRLLIAALKAAGPQSLLFAHDRQWNVLVLGAERYLAYTSLIINRHEAPAAATDEAKPKKGRRQKADEEKGP